MRFCSSWVPTAVLVKVVLTSAMSLSSLTTVSFWLLATVSAAAALPVRRWRWLWACCSCCWACCQA